jgi:hypothetical protein
MQVSSASDLGASHLYRDTALMLPVARLRQGERINLQARDVDSPPYFRTTPSGE